MANDHYSSFIISNTLAEDKKASEITLKEFDSIFNDLCEKFEDLETKCNTIASSYGPFLTSSIGDQLLTSIKPAKILFDDTIIKLRSPLSSQTTEVLHRGKSRYRVLMLSRHMRAFQVICNKHSDILKPADPSSLEKINLFNCLSSLQPFRGETDAIRSISLAFKNFTAYLVNTLPHLNLNEHNEHRNLKPEILDEREFIFQKKQEEEDPFTPAPELTIEQGLELEVKSALSNFFKELNEDELKKQLILFLREKIDLASQKRLGKKEIKGLNKIKSKLDALELNVSEKTADAFILLFDTYNQEIKSLSNPRMLRKIAISMPNIREVFASFNSGTRTTTKEHDEKIRLLDDLKD